MALMLKNVLDGRRASFVAFQQLATEVAFAMTRAGGFCGT